MPHPNDHHTSTQKFFRVATWLLGFVVLVVVILVVAKQFHTVEVREDRTIENLMGQWKNSGLPVGLILPADNPLGAMRAAEADIDGTPVLVYQFDPFDAMQIKTLDKIKVEGSIMHDGQKTSVLVNGPFVLADYAEHPDKDAIVKTFQGFGTFEGIEAERKLEMPPKN
jgi:hypothetical protein